MVQIVDTLSEYLINFVHILEALSSHVYALQVE